MSNYGILEGKMENVKCILNLLDYVGGAVVMRRKTD